MIIAKIYEIPDKCPENCEYRKELEYFSQGNVCTRCPVLNCGGDDPAVDRGHWPAEDAKMWAVYFGDLKRETK